MKTIIKKMIKSLSPLINRLPFNNRFINKRGNTVDFGDVVLKKMQNFFSGERKFSDF